MNIRIVAVGKIRETYLKEAQKEYVKRLTRYAAVEVIEKQDEKTPEGLSYAELQKVLEAEADRILKSVTAKQDTFIIALDIKGESLDSVEFSQKISGLMLSGISNIIFIIGGSSGLDKRVLDIASMKLSLSRMTFPHQIARVIILEQVYRAFKIINGEVYHK